MLFALAIVAAGCSRGWKVSQFKTTDALFQASVRELGARRWDNAIAGFERLTQTLPARDAKLPLALFYLGQAHEGKREFILAATTYTRVSESFPDDTLADDAIYRAGRSYARLWKKPALDASYGETAVATFKTLLDIYPNSELRDESEREMKRLNNWMALKTFENGMHYFRRKAFESSLIYFGDVVRLYPETPTARDAMVQMVLAYRRINYQTEAREACDDLRQRYSSDRTVATLCGAAPPQRADSAKTTAATPNTPPAPPPTP
ncbi:MAG TPA: outer membrane protein assembly factor BamD [Gemmatimonadaceae bacterium]|nr:outer membrane protein assembly factor BamD [Gemmatimonadaceae bacterium]